MSKYQEKNCPVTQTLSYNTTMMTNLALINCQSACNKADVIKDHLIDHDIDILSLTETWFKSQHDQRTSDITPSGYKLVHTPRTGRKGGGVALLYKSGLMLSVLKLTDEQPSSFEYIMTDFTHSARHIRVIVLYRPPSSQKRRAPFSDFIREFSALLDQQVIFIGNLVIVGDFNIHWGDCKSNGVNLYADLLMRYKLNQLVKSETHSAGHRFGHHPKIRSSYYICYYVSLGVRPLCGPL